MVVLLMSFDPPSCFEMEGRFDLARTTPDVPRCDRRALLNRCTPRATLQVLACGAIAHGAQFPRVRAQIRARHRRVTESFAQASLRHASLILNTALHLLRNAAPLH